MDKQEFEAIVAACVADPRKLYWLEGFAAGAIQAHEAAAAAAAVGKEAANGTA